MEKYKTSQMWVVQMSDEEWFGGDAINQPLHVENARADAIKNKCLSFQVFAIPDPLLPVWGIDRRTCVHTEKVAADDPYAITATYHAEMAPAIWNALTDQEQFAMLRTVRDALAKKGHKNPGRYEIFVCRADGAKKYLERGRV